MISGMTSTTSNEISTSEYPEKLDVAITIVFLEVTNEGVPKNVAVESLNSIPSGNADCIESRHESHKKLDGTIEND